MFLGPDKEIGVQGLIIQRNHRFELGREASISVTGRTEGAEWGPVFPDSTSDLRLWMDGWMDRQYYLLLSSGPGT